MMIQLSVYLRERETEKARERKNDRPRKRKNERAKEIEIGRITKLRKENVASNFPCEYSPLDNDE